MPILLFDGHCNLCNAGVQYVVKRDPSSTIRFASLQSGAGRRLLVENNIDPNYIDSLVLFEEYRGFKNLIIFGWMGTAPDLSYRFAMPLA